MNIIYIHGLDSSKNSVKGQLLAQYCQQHYPKVKVIRPDLNAPPHIAFKQLCDYLTQGKSDSKQIEQTVLMGSSLGGYFASLVSNKTGCMAVLLNPSTQPHISLQRFLLGQPDDMDKDSVVYTTCGGWKVTPADLDWFATHPLRYIRYPKRLFVLIKAGDELLDPQIAAQFYSTQGAETHVQAGGDHRMTDFEAQLPMIMQHLQRVVG